ncbi:MAG: dethiobiotin synthase [Candidatus Binatus sp.]|uniref:dethiobiotin synthase n=1 Tax=Candidatus Binatus sp. TaxID=2811406 RepID=UPI002721D287|nr:dethiobiotin synthase [Candidatus Binatus sp.]MDO8432906.1 dethiobiotin synthase [Candidatus Binatus sp.]
MGRRFLITGTEGGVGKTTIGCALGFAFRARGMRVGVMKPVDTGCIDRDGELYSADAQSLALAASCAIPLETICPYRYRSRLAPAVAAEVEQSPPPDIATISRYFREIANQSDALLVEGAGGLADPVAWGTDFADLAAMLDLEVVAVAANRPGCINAATLALSYMEAKSLKVAGLILCDVDQEESPATRTNERSLQRIAGPLYLGRMRYREPLAKSIVESLL